MSDIKNSKDMVQGIIDSVELTKDVMIKELNRQKDKLMDNDDVIAKALLSAERMTKLDNLKHEQLKDEKNVLSLLEEKEKELKDLMTKFSKKG